MRKYLLPISLAINLLCAGGLFFAVQRVGGWRFVLHRLQHGEEGIYKHRIGIFEQQPDSPGAVVFLGDSQTALYEWTEWYGRDTVQVLNRGIAGDFIEGVQARLPEVLRHKPAIILLQLGVNDLLLEKNRSKIAADYRALVGQIRKTVPDTRLILQSVFPVNNRVKETRVTNADIQDLNQAIRDIALEYTLPYIDIYTPLTNAAGDLSDKFTTDGIHLNAQGYAVWKNALKSIL